MSGIKFDFDDIECHETLLDLEDGTLVTIPKLNCSKRIISGESPRPNSTTISRPPTPEKNTARGKNKINKRKTRRKGKKLKKRKTRSN